MRQQYNIATVNKHRDDTIGGSELQGDLIASELIEGGHQVTYLAMAGYKVRYDSLSYNVIKSPVSADAVISDIIKANPDIIYWRFNKYLFLPVVKWVHKSKIPSVFSTSSVGDVKPGFQTKSVVIKIYISIRLLAKQNQEVLVDSTACSKNMEKPE